jgi:hypothetical protein
MTPLVSFVPISSTYLLACSSGVRRRTRYGYIYRREDSKAFDRYTCVYTFPYRFRRKKSSHWIPPPSTGQQKFTESVLHSLCTRSMPRLFEGARRYLRRRRGEAKPQTSSSTHRESFEMEIEMERASQSLIYSTTVTLTSSLPPDSLPAESTDLGSQSVFATYLQPEGSVVASNESGTVISGSDLPVQSVSTSTGPARSTIFDHCATDRSYAINSAVDLVADILSATYSFISTWHPAIYVLSRLRGIQRVCGRHEITKFRRAIPHPSSEGVLSILIAAISGIMQ